MKKIKNSLRNFKVFTSLVSLLFFASSFIKADALTLYYGITVSTEAEQLNRLLKQLNSNLDEEDIIFIQIDTSNTNDEVNKVINRFKKIIPSAQFSISSVPLNKDFATFKNNLLDSARKQGCKHLFLIDADEYLSDFLIKNIKWFISKNRDIDLIRVPRANYYVGNFSEGYPGMEKAVIEGSDDLGRFLYPDTQSRIVDLNNINIKFTGKFHETITGHNKSLTLPHESKTNHWDLIHIKTPQEQVKGNKLCADIAQE